MVFRHALDESVILAAEVEETGRLVLDAAFDVHKELGPGLFENIYRDVLADVLRDRGATVDKEIRVTVRAFGREYPTRLRVDLRVNHHVLVELKAAESLIPLHQAQILTYLRWSEAPLGYLMNFHSARLQSGLRRYINPRAL